MPDLVQLTAEVKKLAIEAGSFIRKEREGFQRDRVEEKNIHDYVSYVDKESERKIIKRLKELIPEAGFIAEEGSGSFINEEYCWVVDPLDGTTNFIHNSCPFCISIALRSKKECLIGVVYEICRDECFWTYKGSKAYLGDKEIRVSNISNLDNAFIELGFPYDANKYRSFVSRLIEKLYGNVCGLRLQGAAAAELCYIACGRFEARIEGLLGPWDVAAGGFILQQAGGKITDFEGKDTWTNGHTVFASNKLLHDSILTIIKSLPLHK